MYNLGTQREDTGTVQAVVAVSSLCVLPLQGVNGLFPGIQGVNCHFPGLQNVDGHFPGLHVVDHAGNNHGVQIVHGAASRHHGAKTVHCAVENIGTYWREKN